MMMERCQCMTVRRHGGVSKEFAYDLPQPLPLFPDRLMSPPQQLLPDLLELDPHAVARRLPTEQEPALFRLAADKGKTRESQGLRLARSARPQFREPLEERDHVRGLDADSVPAGGVSVAGVRVQCRCN
jgi:hypothetical protein